MRVELVTVGPGSDDLSLYGHSALCIADAGASAGPSAGEKDSLCYDFGVPAGRPDPAALTWDTLRGRPEFVPIAVDRSILVGTYVALERTVQVQELPLDDGQATALQGRLEAAVAGHEAYWYRPWFDNCTTRVRDAIDAATGGELHAGADLPSPGPTFRMLSEQGFSGHVPELAGLSLFLGRRADRVPTAWERMFLPAGLRDAVEARFGAVPETLHEPREAAVPTSPAAGRAGLVALGAVLGVAVLLASRRWPRALPWVLGVSGILLGVLALAVDLAPRVTSFPELGSNAVALALWPTDAGLAWIPEGPRARYVRVRLVALGVLAVASAVGVLRQPLAAVCLFAALPLAAALAGARRK